VAAEEKVRFSNFVKSLVQSKLHATAIILATACMILFGGALAFAQTIPTNSAKRIESISLSPSQQRAVQWTEGRQRNAKPLPIPVAKATPGGTPKSMPSGPRSVGPRASGTEENVGPVERKSGDPDSIPLRWGGKFFFTKSDGDYVCSAQFIAPHIILTAAHCMRDNTTGEWYRDFLFDLQNQRGETTQALQPKCYAVWNKWVHNSPDDEGFWHFDYAMFLVEETSKTGHLGWRVNYDPAEFPIASKIGYPADIMNGEVVQVASGPFSADETRSGVVMLRHGNPKNAGGSSGGAWVGNFSPTLGEGKNLVISVTSHHIGSDTAVSYGPYLDGDFKTLLEYVQRGCK
jgi:hypothetical protein